MPSPAGGDPLAADAIYADVAEVEKLYGPLTEAQRAQVADLLARASAMLRAAVPSLYANLLSGAVDPVNASTAVVNMVLRVLNNPRGLIAETVGPFRREWNRDLAAQWLYVSPAEIDLVTPPRTRPRAAAATIMARPGLAYPISYGWRGVRRW